MIRDDAARFRQQLVRAGFPEILCPRQVAEIDLEPATGHFRLRLLEPVVVDVGGAVVAFDVEVTGWLWPQRLVGLHGVELRDGRGRRRIEEVRADERRTTLSFELEDEVTSVPFEVFV